MSITTYGFGGFGSVTTIGFGGYGTIVIYPIPGMHASYILEKRPDIQERLKEIIDERAKDVILDRVRPVVVTDGFDGFENLLYAARDKDIIIVRGEDVVVVSRDRAGNIQIRVKPSAIGSRDRSTIQMRERPEE
jgi:hypothetical protein